MQSCRFFLFFFLLSPLMKTSKFSIPVPTIFIKFCTVILRPKGPLHAQRHRNCLTGIWEAWPKVTKKWPKNSHFSTCFDFLKNCPYESSEILYSHSTPYYGPLCVISSNSYDWDSSGDSEGKTSAVSFTAFAALLFLQNTLQVYLKILHKRLARVFAALHTEKWTSYDFASPRYRSSKQEKKMKFFLSCYTIATYNFSSNRRRKCFTNFSPRWINTFRLWIWLYLLWRLHSYDRYEFERSRRRKCFTNYSPSWINTFRKHWRAKFRAGRFNCGFNCHRNKWDHSRYNREHRWETWVDGFRNEQGQSKKILLSGSCEFII